MKSQLINIIEAHICIASNRSASSSYIKEVPQHDPSLRSEYGFRVKLKTVYFILPVLYSHHLSVISFSRDLKTIRYRILCRSKRMISGNLNLLI